MSLMHVIANAVNRVVDRINAHTQPGEPTIELGFHVCPRCVFTWDGNQVVAVVDCGSPLHQYLTGATQWNNEQGNK